MGVSCTAQSDLVSASNPMHRNQLSKVSNKYRTGAARQKTVTRDLQSFRQDLCVAFITLAGAAG